MSRDDRHRAIRKVVAELGHVPSVRRMARRLGFSVGTIAEDYHALGLKSRIAAGRPAINGPSVQVTMRISQATYDEFCRDALAQHISVPAVIQAALAGGRRQI